MEDMVVSTQVDREFWRRQTVLVTGHTGFKGSWLSLWLLQMGAKVHGYSLAPPTNPSFFEVSGLQREMNSEIADIRDLSRLNAAVARVRPTVVLHLAAQPLVRASYGDPIETYSTNVMGTAHVLESVRLAGQPCAVVIVTTDKCYHNREWVWPYREDEAMGGYDPYSSSKGAAELVTAAYRNSYFHPDKFQTHGVGVASARAGNVIGGGDWALDRLVPDAVTAFAQKRKLIIRSPDSVRPWQHVLEPLSGYLILAQKVATSPQAAQAFNFGPEEKDCHRVQDVIALAVEKWGTGAEWAIERNPNQPHEAGLLKVDSSKAKMQLGWYPRWSLDKAVGETVHWYREHAQGSTRLKELALAQIELYEAARV